MTKQPEKTWFALEVTVLSNASEAIEFAFNELAALGTEINNLGKDKPKDVLCVAGYFNEKPDDNTLQNELTEALRIYGFLNDSIKSREWRAVENKDWLEEWKKNWHPTKIGKFVVAPTWSEIEPTKNDTQNQEIIIRIDPEMAFGTGTHETTRLCLQAIEENFKSEMSFLDVGTGTGILAIAAAKFQVHKSSTDNFFLACDTDEDSIEIARKNAALNRVGDRVKFYVGSINEETPEYDFVCANLTADVIVPLLPFLVEKTAFTLILSGILCEQRNLIESELRKLQVLNWKVRILGEWISVTVDCQSTKSSRV